MKKLVNQHSSTTKTSPRLCQACLPSRSQAVNATFGHVASSGRFALWAALALALAGLDDVRGDTITYEGIPGAGGLSFTAPQFNPAMGQLTDVSIGFSLYAGPLFYVYNNTSVDIPFTISASFTGSMSVSPPSGSYSLNASVEKDASFSGDAPANWGYLFGTIDISGSADTSLATDLAHFTGIGSVDAGCYITCDTFSVVPSSLEVVVGTLIAQGSWGEMTYTYNPVPEPNALTLLVGGLALLGLRSKRKSTSFSPTA